MKPISPERFDATFGRVQTPPKIIWTLPAIARRIGTGVDFVRYTLAKQPGSPVRKISGKWYAFEDDLTNYLRGERDHRGR